MLATVDLIAQEIQEILDRPKKRIASLQSGMTLDLFPRHSLSDGTVLSAVLLVTDSGGECTYLSEPEILEFIHGMELARRRIEAPRPQGDASQTNVVPFMRLSTMRSFRS